MSERRISGKAAGAALFSFAIIGAVGYFGYAAIQGDYGLAQYVRAQAQEEKLAKELAVLQAERAVMENKSRRLSRRYLDLDLLDERTRAVLGYVRPDEIVVR